MTRAGDPGGRSPGRTGGRSPPGIGDLFADDGRGQLVLVAAGVVAVALVALLVAYLQLGYHADVRAGGPDPDPGRNAERMLSRAVHEAAGAAQGPGSPGRVATETRAHLAPDVETLEGSRVERGTAYLVEYNATAAEAFADRQCPGGPDRQFGPCSAHDGVVVQPRAGETHVLAVAFDVTVTTDRGTRRLTLVIRAVGGSVR